MDQSCPNINRFRGRRWRRNSNLGSVLIRKDKLQNGRNLFFGWISTEESLVDPTDSKPTVAATFCIRQIT